LIGADTSRRPRFPDSFAPLIFVGNHDVTRLASRLIDHRHLPHALAILLTSGGTPSIYAGDQQAFLGVKENRAGGDDAIRPAFPPTPAELSPACPPCPPCASSPAMPVCRKPAKRAHISDRGRTPGPSRLTAANRADRWATTHRHPFGSLGPGFRPAGSGISRRSPRSA
jgi:glycosidase